jgi:hypothetical protein
MNARGFVLLEWVIASALVIVVAGAIFSTVGPVRDVVERAGQGMEMVTAARAAMDVLVAELREAGANTVVAATGIDFGVGLAAVSVHADLDAGDVVASGSAIRISRVSHQAPQGRLRDAAYAGDTLLRLNTAARCATGGPTCGFRRGDVAALVSDGIAELVTIDAELVGAVAVSTPVTRAFPADSVLCRVHTTMYGLRTDAGGADRLVRLTDGGAEQPVLDNVVRFSAQMDVADIARARRVSLDLRVQASAAEWRGPAGYLFVRGGTGSNARRWLPDLELRMDVGLRNRRVP